MTAGLPEGSGSGHPITAVQLGRVDVVLSRPRYGGNVGSTARAIKNMGLGGLVLAAPDDYMASEARMMAASAGDILDAARTAGSLEAALQPFDLVLGASRRVKSSRMRIMTPREAAGYLAREMGDGRAAVVFGPEDSGLTGRELTLCQGIVSIPASEACPSLNLAQSVMVVAYELRMALEEEALQVRSFGGASREEYDTMLRQLESVLDRTGFFIRNPKDRVMLHLREVLAGGVKTSQDARIVRGIFRRISWALTKGSGNNFKRRSDDD